MVLEICSSILGRTKLHTLHKPNSILKDSERTACIKSSDVFCKNLYRFVKNNTIWHWSVFGRKEVFIPCGGQFVKWQVQRNRSISLCKQDNPSIWSATFNKKQAHRPIAKNGDGYARRTLDRIPKKIEHLTIKMYPEVGLCCKAHLSSNLSPIWKSSHTMIVLFQPSQKNKMFSQSIITMTKQLSWLVLYRISTGPNLPIQGKVC